LQKAVPGVVIPSGIPARKTRLHFKAYQPAELDTISSEDSPNQIIHPSMTEWSSGLECPHRGKPGVTRQRN
jgi:hypothetical protein